MNDKAGEHFRWTRPILIVKRADFAVAEMDLAKNGAGSFAEAESFAGSRTYHPIGEFIPIGLGLKDP